MYNFNFELIILSFNKNNNEELKKPIDKTENEIGNY